MHAPWWVRLVIGLAGTVVVLTAATLLFRAPRDTRRLDVTDEAYVRAMLRDHGDHDSLGYFATRRDKSVVWDSGEAATARSGVSYRVIGSVSLASGNPVGDPEFWPEAIARWRDEARGNGWSLAVMGAGHDGATAYAEAGLTMLDIGDEAIVDMGEFSLNGPGMKAVRQSVSRLQRRGYTTQVLRHATLTDDDFAELSTRGRPVARRRRRRARLLDGARPARRPPRRRRASWSRPGTVTSGCAGSSASSPGAARACPST